ncbi:MAG: FecR family protein [Pseudomonadota bacterium]
MRNLVLMLLCWVTPIVAVAGEVGVLLEVRGPVTLERAGAQVDAVRRLPLEEGDVVRTGDGARVRLRLDDGTLISLGANTTWSLFTYRPDRPEKPSVVMDLVTGALRVVTGHVAKMSGANVKVVTPAGSIAVRGTDFWAGNIFDADAFDVLLVSGTALDVRGVTGRVILDEAGEGTTLRPAGAPGLTARIWPRTKVDKALETVEVAD